MLDMQIQENRHSVQASLSTPIKKSCPPDLNSLKGVAAKAGTSVPVRFSLQESFKTHVLTAAKPKVYKANYYFKVEFVQFQAV